MVTGLFIATAVLYGIASGLYLVHLSRGTPGIERSANVTLVGAVVLHLAFLIAEYQVAGHSPIADIHSTLTLLSLGTVVGFLVAGLRNRIGVLGAFITPVTLLFFLGSGLGRNVAPVSQELRSVLLRIHVTVNILGVVAFAIAFGASAAYVIQERLLRRKRLGGIFQRLPPLDVLDSLSFHAVTIGFPLFTVGVITGAFWVVRHQAGIAGLSAAQGVGLLAWVVFASVLVLRVVAGWQGRRAALGTIVGFACAIAVLVGYVVQAGRPS